MLSEEKAKSKLMSSQCDPSTPPPTPPQWWSGDHFVEIRDVSVR